MFNRRHKGILFLTLVITGSSLLAGASLTEGLGTFILGVALAWVAGSSTASKSLRLLGRIPGKTWPWLRVQILMAFAGCLFAAVAIWSRFNSFLIASTMSIFGLIVSPLRHLPTQRQWLKVLVWILGIALFFFSAVGVMVLGLTANDDGERMGQMAVSALIALAIGMLWLVKGWKVILEGISPEQVTAPVPQIDADHRHEGTTWLYLTLFTGAIILTLLLGVLAFSAFTNSILVLGPNPVPSSSTPLSPAIALMLFAWWPYASWRGILGREPNTSIEHIKRHKLVTIVIGGLFATVLLSRSCSAFKTAMIAS